ncbi:Deoxyribonuclease-2-like protein, partial [Leptotrombidium deliense]
MASHILNYLKIIRPNIYASNKANVLSDDNNSIFDDLISLSPVEERVIQSFDFKTHNRLSIFGFSKCAKYKKDIYQYIAKQKVKDNLLVKTWTNGRGQALPPMKNVFDVCWLKRRSDSEKNKKIIKYWRSTKDHSKFAIAERGTVVCIGDLNRTRSQLRRGGGILCLKNNDMWNYLSNMIAA